MNDNRLIIAAAGSGKTTFLVNQALELDSDTALITTFTEANVKEIRDRIIAKKGYIPRNITIQTWFSFLLQHGVRPYQSALNDDIHSKDIGFYLTSEKSGRKHDAEGKPVLAQGHPIFWGEKDFLKHYFTTGFHIYSDKLSKFVCAANKASGGEVVARISRIYEHLYVDEVQDLAGYDLDIIKLLFQSKSSVSLVGDPRQVTYLTHHSRKNRKYTDGKIKAFVEHELGRKLECQIDETTLSVSHRNNQLICNYSAKLYPYQVTPVACDCAGCRGESEHLGVFILEPKNVERYLALYKPIQLRWSASTKTNAEYPVFNFGESKGATMDRVLIYPTNSMKPWIRDNSNELKNEARAKFYVALTRARLSSTIVMDFQDDEVFEEVSVFRFNEV